MKVTWNGAKDDPDSIVQYGLTFAKGEAIDVADNHPQMAKFSGNPNFTVSGDDEAKAKTKAKAS